MSGGRRRGRSKIEWIGGGWTRPKAASARSPRTWRRRKPPAAAAARDVALARAIRRSIRRASADDRPLRQRRGSARPGRGRPATCATRPRHLAIAQVGPDDRVAAPRLADGQGRAHGPARSRRYRPPGCPRRAGRRPVARPSAGGSSSRSAGRPPGRGPSPGRSPRRPSARSRRARAARPRAWSGRRGRRRCARFQGVSSSAGISAVPAARVWSVDV